MVDIADKQLRYVVHLETTGQEKSIHGRNLILIRPPKRATGYDAADVISEILSGVGKRARTRDPAELVKDALGADDTIAKAGLSTLSRGAEPKQAPKWGEMVGRL